VKFAVWMKKATDYAHFGEYANVPRVLAESVDEESGRVFAESGLARLWT
jgi:hypothetical protein